jgi:hypothetical protein
VELDQQGSIGSGATMRSGIIGSGLRAWLTVAGLSCASIGSSAADEDRQSVMVVVGAQGAEEYGVQFKAWAERWEEAAAAAGADFQTVGFDDPDEGVDRALLEAKLEEWGAESKAMAWLVFIGHGTYASGEAKFNLRGPDVAAVELAAWLQPIGRPLAIIQCASASGPFLGVLSRTNRVVITATQSGDEQNFARFGEYMAGAIGDVSADLDKDGQTSLLEAFLVSARRVADYYAAEGRLATEHALLDDNGDGLGTPADWFEGVRAVKRAAAGALPDGLRAHQYHLVRSEEERSLPEEFRLSRDALELELESLRARRDEMGVERYMKRLEEVMLRLARLYETHGLLPRALRGTE